MSEYSYSSLARFNKCRYLYFRGVQAVRSSDVMSSGSAVHVALAELWKTGSINRARDAVQAFSEAQPPLQSISMDGKALEVQAPAMPYEQELEVAIRAWRFLYDRGMRTVYDRKGQPMVEYELSTPLPHGLDVIHGRADLVARDSSGNVWVIDHKTRANSFQPDENAEYDMQLAIYQQLLSMRGIPTVGSAIFQIRNALPAVPHLNRDGSMSRAAILTDWETYKAALYRHGLSPSEYTDMQAKLSGKEFFRLSSVFRSMDLLETIWKEVVIQTVREIKLYETLYSGQTAPRNMHAVNCNLCSLREFCQAELRGLDTDWLLESGQFTDGTSEVPQGEENVDPD